MMHHRLIAVVAAGWIALSGAAAVAQDAAQFYQQSQQLAGAKKFDEAIEAIKKAIELDKRNALYRATLGDYYYKTGRYDEGTRFALQAVVLDDKVGAYRILAAANAYENQDFYKANEMCKEVLQREKEFGEGPANDARFILDKLADRNYTLTFTLDPRKGVGSAGSLALAFPKGNLPNQSATYEVTGVRSQRHVPGAVNDVLYVVPNPGRAFTLNVKVKVQAYSYRDALARAQVGPLPREAQAHLGPCYSIDPKSPALVKVAAGLKGSTGLDTVRNILVWMKKNIEYKNQTKPVEQLDFQSVDEILKRGHAECRGYAMLFVALCRAADVPARPIWGLAFLPRSQEKPNGGIASHNWAEFYLPGAGWVPVDPQTPQTLGYIPTNYIRFFMDEKKSKTSPEAVPMFNLLNMSGDNIRYQEGR